MKQTQKNPTIFSIIETDKEYSITGIKSPRGVYHIDISKTFLGTTNREKKQFTLQELIEISQQGIKSGGFRLADLPTHYDVWNTLHQNREHPKYKGLVEKVQLFFQTTSTQSTFITSSRAHYDTAVVHNEGLQDEWKIDYKGKGAGFANLQDPIEGRGGFLRLLLQMDAREYFFGCEDDLDHIKDVLMCMFGRTPAWISCSREKETQRAIGYRHDTGTIDNKKTELIIIDATLPLDQKYNAIGFRMK